ncbi:putative sulfoacetate--CoA ligase [Paraburkholderia caffeinitolerans]|uniref:Putative sulfoacetate--CoA ligase n=1 Tax=Paraburkholderia caffeinitolerans TaxID=1723730 RepID=A0A6J5GFX6_9BURK|nr:AMP-binding protein [Paraburkholderia caffeinitolerans]CAB3800121.1 putative sulfoacetate--CoA ligase [Paraburkholderia caffeinitolerans]
MNAPATIRALIEARAVQYPDKAFLLAAPDEGANEHADDATLTFGALLERCQALEMRFREAGLKPGDVVSVLMGNGIQTATLLLGAMYSGLVAHPLNLLCQTTQLAYVIEHSDTRMIFASEQTSSALATALEVLHKQGVTREIALVRTEPDAVALPVLPVHELALADAPNTASAPGPSLPEAVSMSAPAAPAQADIALLMYTSGTTGAPKGVLLSHENLHANARNISVEHRLAANDRVLASLPLYHINGLVVTLLAPLWHAGSVVLPPRFSARTFWRDASRYGCTWINVVPTIIAYLLDGEEPRGPDLKAREALKALKFCRSASAALPADHHRAFEARFGIGVIETMGMTETAAPVFSNPYDISRRRIGSIGLPSGSEARVIDRDGRVCGPHECGEIVLRGEQIMRGYYKRQEETAKAFTADGWLRTGDLGYRDDEGYFYINGRSKELIIKGGENIAPREIDEALLRHPGVLDAAAVGVPDPAYGQEIVAFVVPRDTHWQGAPDPADLRAHCLRELGRYKTPREFRFVSELPRGPSGKVQRLKLVTPSG